MRKKSPILQIPPEKWDTFVDCIADAIEIGKGIGSQYEAFAEEAGELIVAAMHRKRRRIEKEKFLEEMVDTFFLIQEFIFLEGISQEEVDEMINKKLEKFKLWCDVEKNGQYFYKRV